MDRQQVADEIKRRALAANLDPGVMQKIGWIESRLNPNAKAKSSSASGVFQFINSTGQQYGLTNPFDPVANIDAGIRLASDNRAGLMKVLGREPTPGELYLAHQQGLGGATKLLANPGARAVDVVGAKAVQNNGGSADMSAGEFSGLWTRKMGDAPLTVDVRKSAPADPGMFAEAPPQAMGMPAQPQPQPPQTLDPAAFQTAVFNSQPGSTNDALNFRLQDDAAQRGYASWDQALKSNQPPVSEQQAAYAKFLSGAWT